MKSYKHSNGHRVFRAANGRFKKTYLHELVDGVNEKGLIFICNVCNREFHPVMLEGKCCGVNDKRLKEIVYHPREIEVMAKIDAIKNRAFINRIALEDIADLERSLYWIRQDLKKQLTAPQPKK